MFPVQYLPFTLANELHDSRHLHVLNYLQIFQAYSDFLSRRGHLVRRDEGQQTALAVNRALRSHVQLSKMTVSSKHT
jgi:hypothetical protein